MEKNKTINYLNTMEKMLWMLALKLQRKKQTRTQLQEEHKMKTQKTNLPARKETTGFMHSFVKQHLLLMKTAQCSTESMNGTKLKGAHSTPAIGQTEH